MHTPIILSTWPLVSCLYCRKLILQALQNLALEQIFMQACWCKWSESGQGNASK